MKLDFWSRNPFRMWWVRLILTFGDALLWPFRRGLALERDQRFPRASGRWRFAVWRWDEMP